MQHAVSSVRMKLKVSYFFMSVFHHFNLPKHVYNNMCPAPMVVKLFWLLANGPVAEKGQGSKGCAGSPKSQ